MKITRRLHVANVLFMVLVCIVGLSYSPEAVAQSGSGNGTAIWCGTEAPGPGGPKQCDSCGCHKCPDCSNSPCFAKNGEYFADAIDLRLPAVGPALEVARHYLSAHITSGQMGIGWTSNLGIKLNHSIFLYAAPDVVQDNVSIYMPNGRLYMFVWNAQAGAYVPPPGNTVKLSRELDATWKFVDEQSGTIMRFGADGSLTTITDEFGNTQTWSYSDDRLWRITDDMSGRYFEVSYGADGRVSDVQDNGGRIVHYAYDANGSLIAVTDPAGRVTHYSYTTNRFSPLLAGIQDNWGRTVETMTYDPVGRILSYTENGETYTHDYTHVADGYTIKKDSQNNAWIIKYRSDGFITEVVKPDGSSVKKTFTNDGRVLTTTDEVGIRTDYTYDALGRVTSVTRDAANYGPRTENTYHPQYPYKIIATTVKNSLTNQVDPDWQSWRYDYYGENDPAPGALHHVYRVQRDGITLDTISTMTYDTHGRLLRHASASGSYTENTYDSIGNLISVSNPPNNDAGTRPVTTFTYNNIGQMTSVTDPLLHVTTTTYDAFGRPLSVTLPKPMPSSTLEFTTTYSYDIWDAASALVFTNTTDPNGKITRQGHDSLGRLIKSMDALGNTTTYTYTRDVLTSITDANYNVTSYTYDTNRRLVNTMFPDSYAEVYLYYSNGLLYKKIDRKNQAIEYSYDHFRRMTQKTYPSAATISYIYQGQNLSSINDSSVTPNETHLFTYDNSYHVINETQGNRGSISKTYTNSDRLASIGVVGGSSTNYTYYPDGSIDTIEWSPMTGKIKYSYLLSGRYQSVVYPNGQSRNLSFDNQGRLTQISNTHPIAGDLAVFSYGYDFDPITNQPTQLGQKTTVTTTIPSKGIFNAVSGFRYDDNYQIVQANYPSVMPFNGDSYYWTYDQIGNRLTSSVNGVVTTNSYYKNAGNSLNSQRLQFDGENVYAYDTNGNMLTKNGPQGNVGFEWDYNDRLISITSQSSYEYNYDYRGRRTSTSHNGKTIGYIYCNNNRLRDVGADNNEYLYGFRIDEHLSTYSNGVTYNSVIDGQGSIVLLVDSSGTAVSSTIFDAWGVVRSTNDTLGNDYGYTGREFANVGLLYYRARYYDPRLGRFISEDTLRYQESVNWYGYTENNPVNASDPMGRQVNRAEIDIPVPDWTKCTPVGPPKAVSFNIVILREQVEWAYTGSEPIEVGFANHEANFEGHAGVACKCRYVRTGVTQWYREVIWWKQMMTCPPCRLTSRYYSTRSPILTRYLEEWWGNHPPEEETWGLFNNSTGGCFCGRTPGDSEE